MNENRTLELTGWRRPDGRFGIRNHILVIPTSVCSAHTASRIAELTGSIYLPNQHGCCQIGEDLAMTERVLAGFGTNPNVFAALVISLGCETVSLARVAEMIRASGKRCESFSIQDAGGEEKAIERGVAAVNGFKSAAALCKREKMDISDITLALECGGSDTTSGLCANPAIGMVSDRLVALGGAAILSETTEFIGAEHILASRGRTPEVSDKLFGIVRRCEEVVKATGCDLRGTQPTPGNIAGGLTTIEEKSLGCIHKAGSSPVEDVLPYGAAPTGRGLYIMDSPGQDIESITGMVAGGAQVVIFTTGRGTPTGCPIAPVIKLTGNPDTARSMGEHIDVSAGPVVEGTASIADISELLWEELIAVVCGKMTRAEILGHREFGIYRTGPTF